MRNWLKRLFSVNIEIPFKVSSGKEPPVMLGFHARELIKNPAFDAAIKKIEAELTLAWKTSAPKAEKEREHLYYRMEGLAQIKLKLAGMVNNMLLEEKLLKQNQRQSSEGEARQGE